jgi:hypothetical protein
MDCPQCRAVGIEAHPQSSVVIGWYRCPHCDHEWSARLRGEDVMILPNMDDDEALE